MSPDPLSSTSEPLFPCWVLSLPTAMLGVLLAPKANVGACGRAISCVTALEEWSWLSLAGKSLQIKVMGKSALFLLVLLLSLMMEAVTDRKNPS